MVRPTLLSAITPGKLSNSRQTHLPRYEERMSNIRLSSAGNNWFSWNPEDRGTRQEELLRHLCCSQASFRLRSRQSMVTILALGRLKKEDKKFILEYIV